MDWLDGAIFYVSDKLKIDVSDMLKKGAGHNYVMIIDGKLLEKINKKKKDLDSMRPLSKAALEMLRKQFEIELTYNSNAIEGNTLTLRETRLVLEHGITIKGKSLKEHFEAINHKEAIVYIEDYIGREISEELVKKLHEIVLSKINDEESGRYRKVNVRILGAVKTPPGFEKVHALMKSFVEYAKDNPEKLSPVEFAAILHYKLVSIHPFVDGNGRVSRLLMNMQLMKNGYPITIVLRNDRKKYYDCLKEADMGNIKPFVDFIGYCVNRSLDIYLSAFTKGVEYISLAEAAKGTPHSQEYLSLLARKGKLEAIKLGRNWVTTRKAIENYVKKNRK